MNTFVWVLQILLAVAFLGAGLAKVITPRAKLAGPMPWVDDFGDGSVKAIGGLEVLAALGLVLPAATKIAPVLTPLAAVGIGLLMIGAGMTHARRKEWSNLGANVGLLVLAGVIAWARFGPYSL
ncbi:DoxX-like protein [Herbihabitans rhizosphaerae]|uniref:DoxX-like protein n=1 Tax=Herbihabitans rhizosphaerae TaxID=1872711 RepID=A0A4Q7KKK8_9PSEU|nr:DoxX family protein [Herbihabitans rhizosphaerae]RZS34456.1 DoxX-like protein [Herbihabitans rhizosphaerae]